MRNAYCFDTRDLAEPIPIFTYSDLESEQKRDPNIPPDAWLIAFGLTRFGELNYDQVIRIFDCDFEPLTITGEPSPELPIFHAAVVFLKAGQLRHVLLVRESSQLRDLLEYYDPRKIRLSETEHVGDYWNQIRQEAIYANDGHNQTLSPLLNYRGVSWPHWPNRETQEKAWAQLRKNQQAENDVILSPIVQYVLDLPEIKLVLHYEYNCYDPEAQVFWLVQRDWCE